MDPWVRLNQLYLSLSPSEQRVGDFVQKHPERVVVASIQALAHECGTSDATVLRFCRSLGYSGYQDFKSSLIPMLLQGGVPTRPELGDGAPLATYATRLGEDVHNSLGMLEPEKLRRVAAALVQARRIVLVGLAGSAGVAKIFADSLFSIGIPAVCLSDRVEVERMSAMLDHRDVVFGISHSGETPEVLMAVERGKAQGALTAGMTNFSPSPLAGAAEHVFLTSVSESLLGSYSCHPRVLELVILEMLLAETARRANPKAELA